MGKVLRGIVEIGIGTILEVVPGLQAVGTALVLSGIASEVALAFAKTPKPPTNEQAIRQPIPPRVSAYGESRRITIIIP